MNQIAIVTDSNSGITQSEAKALGITVIPMPFFVNEVVQYEDIDLTQEQFYEVLSDESVNVMTSQPSPADILDIWDDLLRRYQSVVHIPMSSGLSASYETAVGLAQEYGGKVQVVNNQRISVTQRQSVLDAVELAKNGKSANEIREILENDGKVASIYLMVDTLKYLKKGGRITPAAAMIGTVLNLKPVLQIQGEKLDAFAKVRGIKQAKKTMLEAMKADFEKRFADLLKEQKMTLYVAYSKDRDAAEIWLEEVKNAFPDMDIEMYPVSLSIACHTGPGVIAIACCKRSV